MALFDRAKPIIDLKAAAENQDKVFGTGPQHDYARKMAEELLKRKPENIKHWTQGVAYLLDTLAGVQYQGIAGNQERKLANEGREAGDFTPSDTPPTGAVPPPATEPVTGPTVTVPSPEVKAKLEALAPEKAAPVPPPKEITTEDIMRLGGPAAPTSPEAVPTPVKATMADKPKRNPFDLGAKGVPTEPVASPPEGWTPTIKPFIDEKAPYMSRKRDTSKLNSIVFHHDTSWKKEMSDVENAERLAKYGRRVDPDRGFDPGYHYYIARDGSIIQGAPDDRRAHHVKNGKNGVTNDNAIGIVFTGSDSKNTPPTEAQLKAAEFLGNKLMKDYNIKSDRIYGHGEVNPGHRSSEEGMPGVNLFRNKKVAEALTESPAEPPMALGGPRGEVAPTVAPSDPGMVKLAQYRPNASDVPPQPFGPQPSVAQQPLPAVPAMTREDVARLNRANPKNAAEHEKMYRESLQPIKRDLTTPHEMVEPARPGMDPRYQINMPVQGQSIPTARGPMPTQYSIDTRTGQGGYTPGGIGPIPNLFDDKKFPSVAAPAAPPKDPWDTLGEIGERAARADFRGDNVKAQGEFANKALTEDLERGKLAMQQSNDWDMINATIGIYGKALPSTIAHNFETNAKQFAARFLGIGAPEVEKLAAAGELQNKILNQTIINADSALGGNVTNLKLSRIEQANPNMATTTEGKRLLSNIARQVTERVSEFALKMEKVPPDQRYNYLEQRANYLAERPIQTEIDGKKVFVGNWQNMDQVKKTVPVGALWVRPDGKIVERVK